MSRVSRKSNLSPSVTRGSNDIDLGKNSGVDMGQKSQPSMTSGGIGVTQEVTNIGGTSVNVGVNVDVTPIDFGVNIDSDQGTISVSGGAEVPGGLLGVSGGIEVDINTGEITGGSIGGEVGGVGINLSNSKKGCVGVEFTYQLPVTPIELSIGLGFPPKELTPSPTPTPTPSPTPSPAPAPGPDTPLPPIINNTYIPEGDPVCLAIVGNTRSSSTYYNGVAWECGGRWMSDHLGVNTSGQADVTGDVHPDDEARLTSFNLTTLNASWRLASTVTRIGRTEECSRLDAYIDIWNLGPFECKKVEITITTEYGGRISGSTYDSGSALVSVRRITAPIISTNTTGENPDNRSVPLPIPESLILALGKASHINAYFNNINELESNRRQSTNSRQERGCTYTGGSSYYFQYIVNRFVIPERNISPPPPFPNPPPRRQKKVDACCRENLRFLRAIYTQLGLYKFPGQLPSTIIQEIAEEGQEAAEPSQVPIPTLVDLLMWQFERDDERWGQWQVQIDIK